MLRKISYIMFGYPRPDRTEKKKSDEDILLVAKKLLEEPEVALKESPGPATPKAETKQTAGMVAPGIAIPIPKPLELKPEDDVPLSVILEEIKQTPVTQAPKEEPKAEAKPVEPPKDGGMLADIFSREEVKESTIIELFVASLPDVGIDEIIREMGEVKALMQQRKLNRARSAATQVGGTQEH